MRTVRVEQPRRLRLVDGRESLRPARHGQDSALPREAQAAVRVASRRHPHQVVAALNGLCLDGLVEHLHGVRADVHHQVRLGIPRSPGAVDECRAGGVFQRGLPLLPDDFRQVARRASCERVLVECGDDRVAERVRHVRLHGARHRRRHAAPARLLHRVQHGLRALLGQLDVESLLARALRRESLRLCRLILENLVEALAELRDLRRGRSNDLFARIRAAADVQLARKVRNLFSEVDDCLPHGSAGVVGSFFRLREHPCHG